MSKKLRITLTNTIALLDQFKCSLSSSQSENQTPAELSDKNALSLLSASSAALKSQVTKLSLLTVTSPFTHSAVSSVLSALNESVLPSLVTSTFLVTPDTHTIAFRGEVDGLVQTALKELLELVKVVKAVADKKDEEAETGQKKESDLSQGEKDTVTVAAGRVWDVCDTLIDVAAKGVVGFMVRRVEEWRDLVRDAVEEIEGWDPDEDGDEFFDEILDDEAKQDQEDNDESEDDKENNLVMQECKKNTLKILKPVVQIYSVIITNRLNKAPKLSPALATKFELVMKSLKEIPEHADEVAGALYEENVEKSTQYLGKVRSSAAKALSLIELPVKTDQNTSDQQATEDKFTTWSRTWLKVMDEVSNSIGIAKKQ